MVSTRTQTGTLEVRNYNIDNSRIGYRVVSPRQPRGLTRARHTEAHRTTNQQWLKHPRHGTIYKRRLRKRNKRMSDQTTSRKDKPLEADERASIGAMLRNLEFLARSLDVSKKALGESTGKFPARAFGERESVGLSKVGRADKEVEMWESILQTHKESTPDLAPVCEVRLKQAIAARAALADTEENHRIGMPQKFPGELAIKERLETLEWALSTSKFEPERENIRAAIASYKSGEVGYNEHYTLLYAGKVVDTATKYGEFVKDRGERLDRYAEAHGHHWLWYEPPLKVHPESLPKMLPSVGLRRTNESSGLGQYFLNQGYWKRSGWVNRMPQLADAEIAAMDHFWVKDIYGRVDAQQPGPKLSFRCMLDSGATYPSLHTEDLLKLGIDKNYYAAQTVHTLTTAAGVVRAKAYELFVCVLDQNGNHLVDENNPMYPAFAKHLGGLCPVVESIMPITYDAMGREITHRLSGVLPFLACYLSSTPTQNTLYLGEDRNDVVGLHRMPGQKKWDIALSSEQPLFAREEGTWGNPKICFTHRGGVIVDEDDPNQDFVSRITVGRGTSMEHVVETNPRADCAASMERQRIAREREAREMGLGPFHNLN